MLNGRRSRYDISLVSFHFQKWFCFWETSIKQWRPLNLTLSWIHHIKQRLDDCLRYLRKIQLRNMRSVVIGSFIAEPFIFFIELRCRIFARISNQLAINKLNNIRSYEPLDLWVVRTALVAENDGVTNIDLCFQIAHSIIILIDVRSRVANHDSTCHDVEVPGNVEVPICVWVVVHPVDHVVVLLAMQLVFVDCRDVLWKWQLITNDEDQLEVRCVLTLNLVLQRVSFMPWVWVFVFVWWNSYFDPRNFLIPFDQLILNSVVLAWSEMLSLWKNDELQHSSGLIDFHVFAELVFFAVNVLILALCGTRSKKTVQISQVFIFVHIHWKRVCGQVRCVIDLSNVVWFRRVFSVVLIDAIADAKLVVPHVDELVEALAVDWR